MYGVLPWDGNCITHSFIHSHENMICIPWQPVVNYCSSMHPLSNQMHCWRLFAKHGHCTDTCFEYFQIKSPQPEYIQSQVSFSFFFFLAHPNISMLLPLQMCSQFYIRDLSKHQICLLFAGSELLLLPRARASLLFFSVPHCFSISDTVHSPWLWGRFPQHQAVLFAFTRSLIFYFLFVSTSENQAWKSLKKTRGPNVMNVPWHVGTVWLIVSFKQCPCFRELSWLWFQSVDLFCLFSSILNYYRALYFVLYMMAQCNQNNYYSEGQNIE